MNRRSFIGIMVFVPLMKIGREGKRTLIAYTYYSIEHDRSVVRLAFMYKGKPYLLQWLDEELQPYGLPKPKHEQRKGYVPDAVYAEMRQYGYGDINIVKKPYDPNNPPETTLNE